MVIVAVLLLGALFVAYANGANDNFNGVATLYGSGTVRRWCMNQFGTRTEPFGGST